MKLRDIDVSKLNPAEYNPRVDLRPGDPEYHALEESIDRFGVVQPIVWNRRTGHVVGGHQRLAVLKARGNRTAPVVVVDLPLDREKALNLALNKVQGRWDEPRLGALLDELLKAPGFDFAPTGFDPGEARDLVARVMKLAEHKKPEAFDADTELAAITRPVTRPGDLILLGRDPARQHRLLCADSTRPEDVRRLKGASGPCSSRPTRRTWSATTAPTTPGVGAA